MLIAVAAGGSPALGLVPVAAAGTTGHAAARRVAPRGALLDRDEPISARLLGPPTNQPTLWSACLLAEEGASRAWFRLLHHPRPDPTRPLH